MIQIDIPMPKGCLDCPFNFHGYCTAQTKQYDTSVYRPEGYVELVKIKTDGSGTYPTTEWKEPTCPLVEVSRKDPTPDKCPFCGGKAKISFKQGKMLRNGFGDTKQIYRVQVICNKCHARGKPVTTDWIINPMPHSHPEQFAEWINQAVEAWNRR